MRRVVHRLASGHRALQRAVCSTSASVTPLVDAEEGLHEAFEGMELRTHTDMLALVKGLESAVETVQLGDEEACMLLDVQVSRMEESPADETRKELQKVRVLFKQIEANHSPGAACYNMMIIACCCAGEPALAETYIEKTREKGIPLTATTYNAMLQHVPRYGADMEGFVTTMKEAGVQPDGETYKVILNKCKASCDGVAAMKTLRDMKQKEEATAEHHNIVMQTLALYFANKGDGERLRSTLDVILATGIPLHPYEELPSILSHLVREARTGSDTAALATSLYHAAVPDTSVTPPLAVYHSLLRIYAHTGHPDSSIAILKELQARDIETTTVMIEKLAEAHLQAGDTETAQQLFEKHGIERD
eukprot:TRINITY_DN16796_c0_g1_i1.p1 TRINITY_DN16796_c0_g1~~TRINITY_DN16796_c0_g1_i1.p1  ORF type:complete len:363 (+),score=111.54 TRINITY_DN16796_c0_g1_i1:37-1125(+)